MVRMMTPLGFTVCMATISTPTWVAATEHTVPTTLHRKDAHTMTLGPADPYFDLRFLDAMILHHQGALVMAEVALAKSRRAEVITLSQEIIAAQMKEIEQMQQWRQDWYPQQPDQPMMWHAAMNHMMPMGSEEQQMMRMDSDLGTWDPEFDYRYLTAMIRHHEGAVIMAREVRKHSRRPELKTLAQAIERDQTQEITMMQAWLQQWYGQDKSE